MEIPNETINIIIIDNGLTKELVIKGTILAFSILLALSALTLMYFNRGI